MSRFETLRAGIQSQREARRISIWREHYQAYSTSSRLLGGWIGILFLWFIPPFKRLSLLSLSTHCDYLEVVSDLGFPGGLLVFGSIFWVLAILVGTTGTPQALSTKPCLWVAWEVLRQFWCSAWRTLICIFPPICWSSRLSWR